MVDEINYEIVQPIGVIKTTSAYWTREVNIISWSGRPARFDIRDWSPEHNKPYKGLTFTKEEMYKLCELIEKYKKENGE